MKERIISIITLTLFLFASILTVAQAADPKSETGNLESILKKNGKPIVYFVLMAQDPAIAYEGSISGLKATKPGKGKKINPRSAHVKKYRNFLTARHDAVLKAANVKHNKKIYDYSVALNGFAAQLSPDQADALAKQPDVVLVRPDVIRYKTTDNAATYLGITDPGGLWDKNINGEDIIVGVIDTGIWPEHPSFEDDGSYSPLPLTLDGSVTSPCDFGNTAHNPGDAPFECNNKLIGARQMLATYRFFMGADSDEFDSARDDDGHGTHTASTAGGNQDIGAGIYGIPRGYVSGIAPRARIIAYKGLGELGGFGSDLAAAIDQAVADGVDVINYSVGGGASLTGADDIAFLFAADAGVFVATSAGNSGPGAGSIGGPASVPWLTSVGASTQDRAFISEITLNGPEGSEPPTDLWGGSVTPGIENYNLVDAEGKAGDVTGECLTPFPSGAFQPDDCVLCNQYNFGISRSQRVLNVAAGGGGAVIFHNSPGVNMTPTDNHPLPAVHMLHGVGNPLKAYLSDNPGQVTVSFTTGDTTFANDDLRVVPNMMASFSSRGPDPVAEEIIKPDVTAPGVNILAGASPMHVNPAVQGEYFQSIMGTSMSSPVVAGIFALLKQAHPDWTPAMAKSALMTTAHQNVLKEDGITSADPFDMGAGHVNPEGPANKGSMLEPGLAYHAGLFEYAAFTCGEKLGVFTPGSCDFLISIGIPTEAYNLNLPSIGIAELAGSVTITRAVTSVTKENGWRNFTVSVEVPSGFEATVSPSEIRLKKGQTATYQLTLTNVGAPIGEWRFGSLTWKDKSDHYNVYSPIAVRASLFEAPAVITGSGEMGSTNFDVSFGYTGVYSAAAHGLEPATVTSDNVVQDPDQNFDPSDGFSKEHQFSLTGAAFFRIAIPPEATEPDADLDIFVYDPSNNLVATSTSGGTDELIDISQPVDGIWSVYVHGWAATGGDSDYDMYTWVLSATPGGNLSIDAAPNSALLGVTDTIDLSWTGATLGEWHIGAVSHTGDTGLMGMTLIEVNNR
ncbi:S8 family serine peptidase [Desulfobacula sp.]|uniref:S8 family serine peptidase n=1 Tax=Desulfobacula sp. TaxID=2593537 RepID=UPI002619FE18|nr:S8 family serine peptidase [Desulfobacula sp.]